VISISHLPDITPRLDDDAGKLCAALLPLAGNRFALIDERDDVVASSRWTQSSGYPCRAVPRRSVGRRGGRSRQVLVYLHRLLMGAGGDQEVDHANRRRHDCRRSNLRFCTPLQNSRNKRSPLNTSGYHGVYWAKSERKWKAAIRVDGVKVHLGYFTSIEEAARKYDQAAVHHFGEFAVLNFAEQALAGER
jgi:hypothetical protein